MLDNRIDDTFEGRMDSLPGQGDKVSRALAGNRLGVGAVIFFIIAAAAPLTAVSGVATLAFATTGNVGLPISYLAVAAVLMVFAVGYVAMSRQVANAGALYTYVAKGLGRMAGVSAAFVAVLAYGVLPLSLYGGVGAVLSSFLDARLGWSIPWWIVALITWGVVTALGVLRVDFNSRVLAVLLIGETLLVLLFDAVDLANPAGGTVSLNALSPSHLFASGVGTILITAFLGFLGFEGSAVYSEEARDPKRTVALATYISVAGVGVLYALSTWALTVVIGPDQIAAAAAKDQTALMFNVASNYLGRVFIDIGQVLFITSLFAALVSFHNTAARYLFALGRERVLPAKLGMTSGRTGSPYVGSVVSSALGLLAIGVYSIFGLDPSHDMFYILAHYGALGVLILLAATSFSVIGYFARNHVDESAWRRFVAPGIGGVFLTVMLVLVLDQYGMLLGLPEGHTLNWLLPLTFAVAAVAGLAWGWYLRTRRPDVYRSIGLGAESVVESPVAARSAPAPEDFWQPASYPQLPPVSRPDPGEPAPVADSLSERTPEVLSAQPHYATEPMAHLMGTAYFTDPLITWLAPGFAQRGQVCLEYFRAVVRHALSHGMVDVVEDYSGVAVWHSANGARPALAPPGLSSWLAGIHPEFGRRLDILDRAAQQAHPAEPHHYLAFAAVWPEMQRRGLGTTLLSRRLQDLDAHGAAAYLEATSGLSIALYSRLGFQLSGRPIPLPDGPSIYPMWRPANDPSVRPPRLRW